MTTRNTSRGSIRLCDFCGKTQKKVLKVIEEKERDSHICNECVDLCVEIIEEETRFTLAAEKPLSNSPYHLPAKMTEDDILFWAMK
ncbi:ClpX C4-type zinc finger protein [Nonomuraea cavernae]|uniref:ClpX C4-type zinc finger protein n=1 Tax=Nonomuraea cavernae TaxID=2045107 RepID=UPI00166924B8